MNKLFTVILVALMPVLCQSQDYNYEFLTDGFATVNVPVMGDTAGTITGLHHELMEVHMPVRVIKQHDILTVVSNLDLGDVKFKGEVTCVGRNERLDLIYSWFRPYDEAQFWLVVNPADGYIKMLGQYTQKVEFIFGQRLSDIKISNIK